MLDLVIDECLPDRQVSLEIPERVLSNSKVEVYLCVDEFWRAALEPGRGSRSDGRRRVTLSAVKFKAE